MRSGRSIVITAAALVDLVADVREVHLVHRTPPECRAAFWWCSPVSGARNPTVAVIGASGRGSCRRSLVPGTELPILADAIAHFTCDVHERFPGGDHSIFIGLVRECAAVPGKRPLVYFKSGFGALRDPESELLRETLGWDMPSLSGATPVVRVDPKT